MPHIEDPQRAAQAGKPDQTDQTDQQQNQQQPMVPSMSLRNFKFDVNKVFENLFDGKWEQDEHTKEMKQIDERRYRA